VAVFGAVKGWCIALQRLFSSSYSNIGKSTTQTGRQASPVRCFLSWPIFTRSAPMASLTIFALSAPKKIRSPVVAPVRSMMACRASGERLFTIGD